MSDIVKTAIEGVRARPPSGPPSPKEYDFLFARIKREADLARERARRQAHSRAWELAQRQGINPLQNVKELKGDFWPDEESTDEFLSWLRKTRREDEQRSTPE
jgi:hypothetical protein